MLVRKPLITASLLASALLSGTCMAADATGNASVTINSAISVTPNVPLDFGSVSTVSGGSCTLNPNDGSLTGGATDSCAASSGTPGTFTIVSSPGNLNITVTIGTAVNNDITFAPIWHDGTNNIAAGVTSIYNSATGNSTLNVGGTLTNGPAVSAGVGAWTYNVNVVYP